MGIILKNIFFPAFIGAFFGFLTFLLSEYIRGFMEKRKNYIKALFKIQMICNENSDILSLNISSIENIITNYNKAREQNKLPLSFNTFYNLKYNNDILIDIHNFDFLNEYFSYGRLIERQNCDFNNIYNTYELFKTNRLHNNISSEEYVFNVGILIEKLKIIKEFCDELTEKTKDILVKSRLISDMETPINKYIFIKLRFEKYRKYHNKFFKRINEEKLKLEKEFKQVQTKSKENIDKIIKAN